jgi:hypothetical protein
MSFISHRHQNFDPLKHLDSPEPTFELFGREERNARINEGTFKLAGEAIKSAIHYDLTGNHSVLSQSDVVKKPIELRQDGYGRHNAKRAL